LHIGQTTWSRQTNTPRGLTTPSRLTADALRLKPGGGRFTWSRQNIFKKNSKIRQGKRRPGLSSNADADFLRKNTCNQILKPLTDLKDQDENALVQALQLGDPSANLFYADPNRLGGATLRGRVVSNDRLSDNENADGRLLAWWGWTAAVRIWF